MKKPILEEEFKELNNIQFKRDWKILPAYDKRHEDPKKNYGVHCAEIRMVLIGPKGAVQFVLYTGWHLENVTEFSSIISKPLPADVGYHARKPQYDDQFKTEECEYLDGEPCYYDGSVLRANTWFKILREEGSERIWYLLELEYMRLFEGGKEMCV